MHHKPGVPATCPKKSQPSLFSPWLTPGSFLQELRGGRWSRDSSEYGPQQPELGHNAWQLYPEQNSDVVPQLCVQSILNPRAASWGLFLCCGWLCMQTLFQSFSPALAAQMLCVPGGCSVCDHGENLGIAHPPAWCPSLHSPGRAAAGSAASGVAARADYFSCAALMGAAGSHLLCDKEELKIKAKPLWCGPLEAGLAGSTGLVSATQPGAELCRCPRSQLLHSSPL